METVQIKIKDNIINRLGIKAVKDYLGRELEYLYHEVLAFDIKTNIDKSGIDNEKELESARAKTWKDYQKKFLKGIKK